MFTQKWRDHWGLARDPFACEDADKDPVLGEIDTAAVHSGFDRIFGNPEVPSPGIVFGEKGSGKSGLRLMMLRRLANHNKAHPQQKVFDVEYIDFDVRMEQMRQSIRASSDPRKAAKAVVEAWRLSDHLDGILALGVTSLLDDCLDAGERPVDFTRKQKIDVLLLAALYDQSQKRTTDEGLSALRSALRVRLGYGAWCKFLLIVASILAVGVALVPHLAEWFEWGDFGPSKLWYGAGGVIGLLAWGWFGVGKFLVASKARSTVRHVRVLAQDAHPLGRILGGLSPKERKEFLLPTGTDDASRFDLLSRFLGVLAGFGYGGCYVMVDRVDEPSLLSGSEDHMKQFVQKLLDIKFLQYPNLALKLFLPIEMESLHRNATPEELKRMRLDKSNLIGELKWTGQELYEVANQRLLSSLAPGSVVKELRDLFAEDLDFGHIKETLTSLATPRYAFGFLSAVFSEHVRDLPNELEAGADDWRVPRAHFDVQRAAWIDRTGVLRRSLN